ncbi:MAG: hypothetical protein ABJA64_03060 [Candidatus Saccharibacteria bacterium]
MQRINHKGFTLIELMLSMTFVSLLLVAIAMLTIQISNTYTKGITLRDVNQAGLSISSDLQRSINAAASFDAEAGGNSYEVQPTGGRLCLGKYSYVWNNGDKINQVSDSSPLSNKFVLQDGSQSTQIIRFVKVADQGKTLCQPTNQDAIKNDGAAAVYPDITLDQKATEMLSAGDRDLAIHSFKILSGSQESPIYAISIVIGTNGKDEITGTDSDQCKPPADIAGAQDYCSINRFDIIARVGSKEGN